MDLGGIAGRRNDRDRDARQPAGRSIACVIADLGRRGCGAGAGAGRLRGKCPDLARSPRRGTARAGCGVALGRLFGTDQGCRRSACERHLGAGADARALCLGAGRAGGDVLGAVGVSLRCTDRFDAHPDGGRACCRRRAGIVVLGETVQTGGFRLFALAAAVLVMVAATAALARSEAAATGSPVEADPDHPANRSEQSAGGLGARR
jgi:hypothetical protein